MLPGLTTVSLWAADHAAAVQLPTPTGLDSLSFAVPSSETRTELATHSI